MLGPKDGWQFLDPIACFMFEPLLQSFDDNSIDGLHLTIRLRVRNGGKMLLDPHLLTPLGNLRSFELGSII